MEGSMASMLILAGSTLTIPVLAFIVSYFFWPTTLIMGYNWYNRLALGLRVGYITWRDYRFCYSQRGQAGGATPSVIMLHGFSANKDMWLPVIKFLPVKQHVVCVDMPGHGGSSRTGPEDYSIEGQVTRINQFVLASGLDRRPFHLVGSSMGGNVAGVYAARHPKHLAGVTLICPAGLVQPTDTAFVRLMKELKEKQEIRPEDIALIPSTLKQMEDMLKLCCHTPITIPRQILKGLIDARRPNNSFYEQVFREITSEQSITALQENLQLITAPLQVIWGKDDQVIHFSGASVLQEALPGCQVALLDRCGHAVSMDRPRKTARLLMDFLSAQEVHSSTKKLS